MPAVIVAEDFLPRLLIQIKYKQLQVTIKKSKKRKVKSFKSQ